MPAELIKTTNAKQTTGIHAILDKSYPFLLQYRNDDNPISPAAVPSSEIIKNVLRPNLSARYVVHKLPRISITASAIDDL